MRAINKLAVGALLLLTVTAAHTEDSEQSPECIAMTKQFFLEKMRNDIGPNDDPRAEHPNLIRGLMMRIKLQYPESDMLGCLNDGLIAARASLNIVVPDRLHGGVRELND
jgi:hypothetical protein